MVMDDYHLVMLTIGTAELKAHLSEYLHAVRGGETIIVLDRREPIARIVPMGTHHHQLMVRPARGRLQDVALLGPICSPGDVLVQLDEERKERV